MSDLPTLEEFVKEREAGINRLHDDWKVHGWVDAANDLKAFCMQKAGIACSECGGSGQKLYSSTATWRGGMGGASMTHDVCDVCWGTGHKDQTGADLRAVRNELEGRKIKASRDWLYSRMGVGFTGQKERLLKVAEKLERARWGDDFWLRRTAETVINSIRELVGDERDG